MHGIGIEAINLRDFNSQVGDEGKRVLDRYFTYEEREYCYGTPRSLLSFAAIKAAKQAFLKAVPESQRTDSPWRDLQVHYDAYGRPEIKMEGKALEGFKRGGANSVHLALSHTSDTAVAVVVVE